MLQSFFAHTSSAQLLDLPHVQHCQSRDPALSWTKVSSLGEINIYHPPSFSRRHITLTLIPDLKLTLYQLSHVATTRSKIMEVDAPSNPPAASDSPAKTNATPEEAQDHKEPVHDDKPESASNKSKDDVNMEDASEGTSTQKQKCLASLTCLF